MPRRKKPPPEPALTIPNSLRNACLRVLHLGKNYRNKLETIAAYVEEKKPLQAFILLRVVQGPTTRTLVNDLLRVREMLKEHQESAALLNTASELLEFIQDKEAPEWLEDGEDDDDDDDNEEDDEQVEKEKKDPKDLWSDAIRMLEAITKNTTIVAHAWADFLTLWSRVDLPVEDKVRAWKMTCFLAYLNAKPSRQDWFTASCSVLLYLSELPNSNRDNAKRVKADTMGQLTEKTVQFPHSEIPEAIPSKIRQLAQDLEDKLKVMPGDLANKSALLYHSCITALNHHDPSICFIDLESLADMDSVDDLLEVPKVTPESTITASSHRAVTPPILTERMELNEWTVSLVYLEQVAPSDKLVKLLEGVDFKAIVVPILNLAFLRLTQENLSDTVKPTRVAPVTVDEAGKVVILGDLTDEKQLCKAVAALYYHALEAILYCEKERTDSNAVAKSSSFHKAVVACATSCVIKAVGVTHKLRKHPEHSVPTVLHIADCSAFDFLKVSETFVKALTTNTARGKLGSPLIFELPRMLVKETRQGEILCLDSLLWSQKDDTKEDAAVGGLDEIIDEFKEEKKEKCFWPPEILQPFIDGDAPSKDYPSAGDGEYAEYRSLTYVLRKLLHVVKSRIDSLCDYLDVPIRAPIADQTWFVFGYLLTNFTDLFFERHIDHWILCSLYGVCKAIKYQPEITFNEIIDAYVVSRGPELGDITCQRIVRHVKMDDRGEDGQIANVITLYNKVFVRKMKNYLLKSKQIEEAVVAMHEIRKTAEMGKSKEKNGGDVNIKLNLVSPETHLKMMLERLQRTSGQEMTILQFGKSNEPSAAEKESVEETNGAEASTADGDGDQEMPDAEMDEEMPDADKEDDKSAEAPEAAAEVPEAATVEVEKKE